MPRYYRRRYTRVVKPKKKWATNIRKIEISETVGTLPNAVGVVRLCVNQNQVNEGVPVAPTPTIVKTGNFKVQCDAIISTNESAIVNIIGYVLYIPEGVYTAPDGQGRKYEELNGIVERHPEWIIAWRQFSSDQIGNRADLERVSFSSRLKRNLNSGDEVYFVVLASKQTGTGFITSLEVNGMCQFWTCAN